MPRQRLLGLVILLASIALVLVSVLAMFRRVEAYNEQAAFPHYRFDVSTVRSFEVHGRKVTIEDVVEDRQAMLRVDYGGAVSLLRVTPPPATGMPDLGIYGDWVKIVEVHEVGRNEAGSLADRPGTGRLVLLCRLAPEGYDPETWGSVRRADWTFELHEFQEDGTIRTSAFRWPRSAMGEKGLAREIEAKDPGALALAELEPLKERTWQYQAALHVIPKLNVPKYRFKDTAMKAMGWTLPVAGFSGLGLLVGIGLLLAPRRTKGA